MNDSGTERRPSIWRTVIHVAIAAAVGNVAMAGTSLLVHATSLGVFSAEALFRLLSAVCLAIIALLSARFVQCRRRTTISLAVALIAGNLAGAVAGWIAPRNIIASDEYVTILLLGAPRILVTFSIIGVVFSKLCRKVTQRRLATAVIAGVVLSLFGSVYAMGVINWGSNLAFRNILAAPTRWDIAVLTASLYVSPFVFFGPTYAIVARMLIWAADAPENTPPTPQTPPPAPAR